MQGIQFVEILVLAAVAGFLAFKLYSVLGRAYRQRALA